MRVETGQEVRRDLWEQAHGGELGAADGEAAQRQHEQGGQGAAR